MDAYIGEIRYFPFDYAPEGWAACNGQLLPVEKYQALYSVIGVRFGGRENREFAVPNLVGRAARGVAPAHVGQVAGNPAIELTIDHLAPHTHKLQAAVFAGTSAATQAALKPDPQPNRMLSRLTAATGPANVTPSFSTTTDGSTLHASALTSPPEARAEVSAMNPYLVLNPCICWDGEYPVRAI